MTTTTTPSGALAKLEQRRSKEYTALQAVKRERNAWDAELQVMRAQGTERTHTHPEEYEGAQRLPREGTEAAALAQRIKDRQVTPNPNERDYSKALERFHAADVACTEFRRENVVELFAEADSDVARAQEEMREGWELIARGGERYQRVVNRALDLARDVPRLNGQSIAWDPRPNDWARQARDARDAEIGTPGPNPNARDKVLNGG